MEMLTVFRSFCRAIYSAQRASKSKEARAMSRVFGEKTAYTNISTNIIHPPVYASKKMDHHNVEAVFSVSRVLKL
jgi:hypothetical protein